MSVYKKYVSVFFHNRSYLVILLTHITRLPHLGKAVSLGKGLMAHYKYRLAVLCTSFELLIKKSNLLR